MAYKNIIFDLGGVLIEWSPIKHLQELQVPLHFNEVFNSLLWASHDGGCLSRSEVIAKLPGHYDKEVFSYCVSNIAQKLAPIQEMIDLFHEVRRQGYKVYILSNMPKETHEELVELHDFFNYPDGEIYSYKVGAIKPQPQIYEALLNTYKLHPHESIFIDDREENILAAKKFGIEGIVCQNPTQVRKELKKSITI